MATEPVVTRIAPSPTGEMHIGTVRTALFNYLFAKHYGGTYFVRIEDTDKERNRPEWTEGILKDFTWCGLVPDHVYVQSEHLPRHRELLHSLIESGKAYVSKELAKDDSSREVEVVRLKNPGASITFNDLVRGEVTFDTTELGDFVIARSIDDPLYHFAVVVDDADSKVSHIIRAEEHISNTPRQILIQEALGFSRPHYAHIPLILAPDRSKLSKRKHGASLRNYREQGYLPQGVINYLALLGWNPGTDEEYFTLEDLVTRFSLDQVQKSGAMFDEKKMRWFNREHLLQLDQETFSEQAKTFFTPDTSHALEKSGHMDDALTMLRDRIETYGDIKTLDEAGEFSYLTHTPEYEVSKLLWKQDPDLSVSKKHLEMVVGFLEPLLNDTWTKESVREAVWNYAESAGKGSVLWPFRVALTGRDKSPDPFEVAGILGKDETISRVKSALQRLAE